VELTHRFSVPASVEDTWAALNDIEGVAGCFPGATVTSVSGDSFEGSCKVKLGPIALVYNGSGAFVTKDESAHRMELDARGKDKRGNGTAGAHVTATLSPSADGTDVEVLTDLAVTGKPAQFGRGMMHDVSDKLLQQFVTCLETRVAGRSGEVAGPATAVSQTGAAEEAAPAGEAAPPAEATGAAGAGQGERPADGDDALDLGAAVLPVVLKSYGRQVAAALVGLLVLWFLLRRRR
jgi:carbon monoxide dehydrogenase subunit G